MLVMTAVKAGAMVVGASTPPDVRVLRVDAAPAASRRRLLASGVLLEMEAAFEKSDGDAALRMKDVLRSAPSQVFSEALFGAVSVPDVKLNDALGLPALIGIAVGSVVFAVLLAAVLGIVALKRRRRRRLQGGAVIKPAGSKSTWYKKLIGKFQRPSSKQQGISAPNSTAQPPLESIQTVRTASHEDELSLRELYACQQRMAAEKGQPSRVRPPPALAESPRPVVAPLKAVNSPNAAARGSMVLFENPLAEDEGNEATAEHIEVGQKPRSNSPSPAVLAGWFKEARQRSAEKKESKLSRRQSFRT